MAYKLVLGTTDTLLAKLKSARSQLLQIYRTVRQVKVLEQMADVEREGYDPWPIDDDANALQEAACAALYNNILTALLDGTLENWRYGYLIKIGRPIEFVSATIAVHTAKTVIWDVGGATRSTFAECITGGGPTGDKVKLRWAQSDEVIREVTGLIVDSLVVSGDDAGLLLATRIDPDLVVNGDMNPDSDWTKGAGWTIGAGVADAAGALNTALSSIAAITVVTGRYYTLSFDMTRAAGTLTASFDGVNIVAGSLTGSYTQSFKAADTSGTLAFTGTGFTGTLDNVTLTETLPVADDSVEVELEATVV